MNSDDSRKANHAPRAILFAVPTYTEHEDLAAAAQAASDLSEDLAAQGYEVDRRFDGGDSHQLHAIIKDRLPPGARLGEPILPSERRL